jgi:hypothetical protein
LKLCLLDANVIIHLHQLGLWGMMTKRFEVYVASTVVAEAMFWTDDAGVEHPIALVAGTFTEVSASPAESAKLKRQFPALQIDAGELESLAWLLSGAADEECQVCSSDAVVFKVLGALNESFRGTSLEELLGTVGDRRRLKPQYTKDFRDKYAALGMTLARSE